LSARFAAVCVPAALTLLVAISGALPAAAVEVPPAVQWQLGSTGTDVRGLEARLVQLRLLPTAEVDGVYRAATARAVSSYQTRAVMPATGKVDEITWLSLRFDTRTPTRAELYPPRNAAVRALDPRCRSGRVMCVDKSARKLSWVVDGTIRRTLQVRFGSQFTPTREGTFRVYRKSADHVSSLFDTPMPYAMFFSGGQAVHYSPDFARVGYAGASHGCVNTRDKPAVARLFREVRLGDRVVVHR
jgi:lipoprotein-anchoring transpeptidase ErfK/SrfK